MLLPALRIVRATETPCKTDPQPHKWHSDRPSVRQRVNEEHAKSECRGCGARALCLAWAFEMESYHVWGGFTAADRRSLVRSRPDLVEDLVMLVKSHINIADGLGGRLRPGVERDIPDAHAQMLIRRGFAEKVGETLAALDEAVAEVSPPPEADAPQGEPEDAPSDDELEDALEEWTDGDDES